MQREGERNPRNLKVIILSVGASFDNSRVRKYFMREGFYLIKSSTYSIILYGDPERFQELMADCTLDVNLEKIRNKRFYEKIYE